MSCRLSYRVWVVAVLAAMIVSCQALPFAPVAPQPGATLSGPMEHTGEASEGSASSGAIELVISSDGTSIEKAKIILQQLKCPQMSGSSAELNYQGPWVIEAGKIDISQQEIKGKFSSPTQASGTLHLVALTPDKCDLGTWNWEAAAVP